MLLCDTSGLLAYFDADEGDHAAVAAAIDEDPGPFVVSPYVLAELDYLLATRRGTRAQLAALEDLAGGAWELPCCEATDVRAARKEIERYGDQSIGLADASIIVLARRYKADRVLTLDHRHFRVLRAPGGGPFALLP